MNSSGSVTGVAEGTAVITYSLSNSCSASSATASVKVQIAAVGITTLKTSASSDIISTVAGNNVLSGGYSGDGSAATAARINMPYSGSVAVDGSGNLYFADEYNYVIRKVNTGGIISTIAGDNSNGYSGDLGPATNAQLSAPPGIAVDGAGNVYIADQNNFIIREVNTGVY